MPSAQLLQERGGSRVVLVQRSQRQPQQDLARVLRYWQDAHVVLEAVDLADSGIEGCGPRPLIVPPIAWFLRWWDGLLSLLGLHVSPRDGFGYIVPEPRHG
jgi:hypothetical protein